MSEDKPLVTVVALCYNHSRYVIETLESIRNQYYPNLEVIIVDDCSKDDSVELIVKWLTQNAPHWRFIRHKQNLGICKSLNETLDLARGKYYKVIACDDVLEPDCLEHLVAKIALCDSGTAMVYGDAIFIDEKSQPIGKTSFTSGGWKYGYNNPPSGMLFDLLAEVCFIPAPAVLAKSSIFRDLKFNEQLHFEDWDMWLRVAKKYKILSTTKAVVKYRIHSQSMYQSKSPEFLDSEMRIAEVHMGFSKAADEHFERIIYEKSILAYMAGGLRLSYWLWKRFLLRKSLKNFAHVLLATFGVKYKEKEKWRRKLSLDSLIY